MPRKRKRRRASSSRPRPQVPTMMNDVWSYDFMFDACANGQQLKCLTVADEFTRERLAIDVAGSIRSGRVIEIWREHYNEVRPHSSPGYLTPNQFKAGQSTTTPPKVILQQSMVRRMPAGQRHGGFHAAQRLASAVRL